MTKKDAKEREMTERVKFDLDMMKWVADKIKEEDYSVFPFEYKECEKCGAAYLPEFGHDCSNTIDLNMHIPEADDEIELIADDQTEIEKEFDENNTELMMTVYREGEPQVLTMQNTEVIAFNIWSYLTKAKPIFDEVRIRVATAEEIKEWYED